MSAAAVEEGRGAGEGSHEGEAVQDGGEREQGEAGGVPLTPLGSPFGRAIIQMVDHDVLVEIARSQERMYVAAPSLNHHTLPHISTRSIAQSLGFPSLQWPSYPRYDCCVFAVILPAVARWSVHALSVSNHSLTRARVRTYTRTRTQLPPTILSPHLISLARSAANHLTGSNDSKRRTRSSTRSTKLRRLVSQSPRSRLLATHNFSSTQRKTSSRCSEGFAPSRLACQSAIQRRLLPCKLARRSCGVRRWTPTKTTSNDDTKRLT